ncbi:MAG: UDP-N-acetylmuramoyl-L-alanyl-D-glutamate--2,6-diaminopimelate ligase [Peptococcaceae bacterium]
MLLKELIKEQKIIYGSGNYEIDIRGLAYDSRQVKPGFVFVAIEGFKTDGHKFIPQAVANGAAALVGQKKISYPAGTAWVQVPDTRLALAQMAARFYSYPAQKLRLIGVTGTNGKTTTTNLIAAIYQGVGKKVGLIGTIAHRIGSRTIAGQHTTPESLDLQQLLAEMAFEKINTAVMEVSSHALALKRVEECLFDIGVFTNLTQDHLDFHQSMDDYLAAKQHLFEMLGEGKKRDSCFAVVNRDDRYAEQIIKVTRVPVITYGINKPAQVQAKEIQVSPAGTSFVVISPWGESLVKLKLTGLFNVYNALAALAVGGGEGFPLPLIVLTLEKISGVRGRFETINQGQDFTVVIDYAHTPDGMENLLKTARQICTRRLITVFGCGGDRDRTKRAVMGEIAARYSDLPVITSDNPRTEDPAQIMAAIEKGVLKRIKKGDYLVVADRGEAIRQALALAGKNDVVVIAGKGHEDYQIIGTQKYPFDDRQEVIKNLKAMGFKQKNENNDH